MAFSIPGFGGWGRGRTAQGPGGLNQRQYDPGLRERRAQSEDKGSRLQGESRGGLEAGESGQVQDSLEWS